MKETSKYEIISHWIDTCDTDKQLDNLKEAIEKRFILDEKTKDDLLTYWIKNNRTHRACDEYNDEQPTDNSDH
jgi:hypothetical protein